MNENERKPVKLILTVADIDIKLQPGMPVQTGVKAGLNGYENLNEAWPAIEALMNECLTPRWIE